MHRGLAFALVGCRPIWISGPPKPATAPLFHAPLRKPAPIQTMKCKSYDASSSSEVEEPPHHTFAPAELPGAPARLLSDAFIVANVAIFAAQVAFPEVTLAGIKSNELIEAGQVWRLMTAMAMPTPRAR